MPAARVLSGPSLTFSKNSGRILILNWIMVLLVTSPKRYPSVKLFRFGPLRGSLIRRLASANGTER
eukprot:1238434-Amphidinium_carterae.2